MDYAYEHGIKVLDTASAYGESEKIIGEYMEYSCNKFKISTKLPMLSEKSSFEYLNTQINSSLSNLGINKIDFYLIHNFNDLLQYEGLIKDLSTFKDEGKIDKIGVSLYEPFELEKILSDYCEEIDVVQIPFNLLDSKWYHNNLLKRAKDVNIKVFARSIFIQGLIFLDDENKMDCIHSSLKNYISRLNTIAEEKKISMAQLAMDYVKSYDVIDGILVGCETVEQLQENINLFNSAISIDSSNKDEIYKFAEDIPNEIRDPRNWS